MRNPLLEDASPELGGVVVELPTMGAFYADGVLSPDADPTKMMVNAASVLDELNYRNPFSMSSGVAVPRLIKRCVRGVLDAERLRMVDVQLLLLAIRSASYGKKMEMEVICQNEVPVGTEGKTKTCLQKDAVEIDLDRAIAQFQRLTPAERWQVKVGRQVCQIAPPTYASSMSFFKIGLEQRKILKRAETATEDQVEADVSSLSEKVVKLQVELMIDSIAWVATSDGLKVEDKAIIAEWISALPASLLTEVNARFNELSAVLNEMQSAEHTCTECGHKQRVTVVPDPTSFFSPSSPTPRQ